MKALKQKRLFLGLAVIVSLSVLAGCGMTKAIKSAVTTLDNRMADAIRSMDYAINALSQQSADWQVVVTNLEKEVSKDLQSTIRSEVTDLARNSVLSAGAEIRCNAEFMRIKLRRELIDLRNELASTYNAALEHNCLKKYQVPLIPQDPVRPFICDIVPSAVDMSLDDERRLKVDIYGFDLKSFPIDAYYLTYGVFKQTMNTGKADFHTEMTARYLRSSERTVMNRPAIENIAINSFELFSPSKLYHHDISSALSIISDFHAVLNLTGSGADLPPNVEEIFLSWDNKVQSEIPILVHQKELECRTWDSTFVLRPVSFIPAAVVNSPYGGHPDAEFAGHGPCIEFNMHLCVDDTKKILNAVVYMDAWECPDDFSKIREDYTEAVETRTIPLITITDPDMIIVGFNLQPDMSDRYIDYNDDADIRYYGSTLPAYKIEFTGDTSGDEAGTKTGAVISFNSIKLKLKKCSYR
jgi:hypothetical protein